MYIHVFAVSACICLELFDLLSVHDEIISCYSSMLQVYQLKATDFCDATSEMEKVNSKCVLCTTGRKITSISAYALTVYSNVPTFSTSGGDNIISTTKMLVAWPCVQFTFIYRYVLIFSFLWLRSGHRLFFTGLALLGERPLLIQLMERKGNIGLSKCMHIHVCGV